MQSNRLSYSVGGDAKWYSNFGNQFSGLSWRQRIWPHNPEIIFHRIENVCPHKNRMDIYGVLFTTWNFKIHKCPLVGKWISKLVVLPENRISLSTKNVDIKPWKIHGRTLNAISLVCIWNLLMTPQMILAKTLKRQNYGNSKIGGCRE